MELILNDQYLLYEVKEKFNQIFPFLKIEFCLDANEKENSLGLTSAINERKALAKYRTSPPDEESIVISEKHKVSELKQLFKKLYGLVVMFFRKVGETWLPITRTYDWTIEKQNIEGYKMSSI